MMVTSQPVRKLAFKRKICTQYKNDPNEVVPILFEAEDLPRAQAFK